MMIWQQSALFVVNGIIKEKSDKSYGVIYPIAILLMA